MDRLNRLLAELGSWRSAVRREAIQCAKALPPQDLIQLIHLDQQRYRRVRPFWWLGIFGSYALTVILMLMFQDWLHESGVLPEGPPLGLLLALFVPVLVGFIPSQVHKGLNAVIAAIADDPVFIGVILTVLAESSYAGEARFREQLDTLLYRHLPQVPIGQARSWTTEQRRVLTWPLFKLAELGSRVGSSPRKYREWCDHSIIVLKLLEQIGDQRELETVKAIVAIKPKTYYESAVQAAAQASLPYLEQRADQIRQEQTLLRAAGNETDGDHLLRAADGKDNTAAPDVLLRPHI